MQDLQVIEQSMMPTMNLQDAVERFNLLGQFVSTIMKKDVDYGVIPGTNKPTLLKPGAEKLTTFFGLVKEIELVEKEEDWTGERHGGEPFFYYWYRVALSKNGYRVAEADGSCNSWEGKYRFRQQDRACPKCKKETIRKSKQAGWYCWAKIGGCGAQFKDGDPAIEKQDLGKVKNPNPADLVNTVQKMALKRALVAAALIGVNASEYFTQDVEDFAPMEMPHREESPPEQAKANEPPKGRGQGVKRSSHHEPLTQSGAGEQESWDSREDDLQEIRVLIEKTKSDESKILEWAKIKTLDEISKDQAGKILGKLYDKRSKMDEQEGEL